MALDPRQQAFKRHYCNPESKTFGNAMQSALEAGFTHEYAKTITAQGTKWFSEIIRDQELLRNAEERLREATDISVRNKDLGDRSLKASMFVAKTLGKSKYSERTELTGANGGPIVLEQLTPEQRQRLAEEELDSGDYTLDMPTPDKAPNPMKDEDPRGA